MILLIIWLAADPNSWTCKEVRAAVKIAGSIEQAESIARAVGASDAMIEKARKCVVKIRPKVG